MKIGIFGGDTDGARSTSVVEDARSAEQDGFAAYTLPQIFALDAMGVLGDRRAARCRASSSRPASCRRTGATR